MFSLNNFSNQSDTSHWHRPGGLANGFMCRNSEFTTNSHIMNENELRNKNAISEEMTIDASRGEITKSAKFLPDYPYQQALKRLNRAIALSQGQFSLILVCCNDALLQQQVVKQVTEQFSGNIQNIVINQSPNTLYTTIKKTIRNPEPKALMIFGLESVTQIDQMLTSSNLVRGQFDQCFSFPLVLWVNNEIMKKLVRLAPDLKNWGTTIRFAMPQNPKAMTTDKSLSISS
jgi:hypothetical protein